MNRKLKLVFTVTDGDQYKWQVAIVNCDDIMDAIKYVFKKYGQQNVCREYHYNRESLMNGTAYEQGLFEEIEPTYEYGADLIKKWNYEILEEVEI